VKAPSACIAAWAIAGLLRAQRCRSRGHSRSSTLRAFIRPRSVTVRSAISSPSIRIGSGSRRSRTAACNAIHDASSRLCRRLLQSADRIESDHLPLTQEFLSYMLGVRRTTLTLLARALQQRRAIEYSRGKIRIVDQVLLEASACECYQVIHREERAWRTGAKA
jgi:hypothetical protein